MILSDVLLLAALALFVLAWWLPRLPRRSGWLWLGAGVAIVSGGYGVWVDRWQAGLGLLVALLFLVVLLGAFRGPRRPQGVPHVSGALFGLLAILAALLIQLFPVVDLPPPSGPNAVGVRDFELIDRQRLGVLNAAADEPRRLLVRVWYPAAPVAGAQPRPYFNAVEAQTTARGFGALLGFAPLLSYLRHVGTNSVVDAPLQGSTSSLPTLFYSHGYTAYAALNTALMEELASHGYVVYAVQHSGDASPTVLPDGQVIPMDPGLIEHMHHALSAGFPEVMVRGYGAAGLDERLDGQLRAAREISAPGNRAMAISAPVWLADRLFVHDALQRGEVPAGVVDVVAASEFSRTGEMGISFGGSTSGAVCMVDTRCAAAVNFDGGDFHFAGFDADLPVPLLMLHADLQGFYRMLGVQAVGPLRSFNDFSYERFDHAGQRADIHRMVLRDSAHSGLTDTPLFMRRPLRDELFGAAPTEVLVGVPNELVRRFFDRYLRGQENDFPKADFARHGQWLERYDNSAVRQWWLAKPEAERAQLRQRIEALKATLPGRWHRR